MRLLPKGTVSSIVLIVLLALILVALAALQYRWSGQVSESVHERMQTNLLASMNQFRMQFNSEFRQLGFLLQPDTSVLIHRDWKSYAESCSSALAAPEIHLVRNIYLWVPQNSGSSGLLILNRQARKFEPVSWPDRFKIVRSRYDGSFALPRQPGPGMRPLDWTMMPQIPMLLRPLPASQPSPDAPGLRSPLAGYLMAELSLEVIQEELPHIFEPFYRGRAASDAQIHGAGLGLFMVKESLSGMGGSISVESIPGKGSAFTIHLPALPENNDNAAAAARDGEPGNAV